MSNLKRKIENITIENKEYIMAFDMESCEIFKELSGKSILKSVVELANYDAETVLYFIASTLREKDGEILGEKLLNGNYDLFSIVIQLFPIVTNIIMQGFPSESEKK